MINLHGDGLYCRCQDISHIDILSRCQSRTHTQAQLGVTLPTMMRRQSIPLDTVTPASVHSVLSVPADDSSRSPHVTNMVMSRIIPRNLNPFILILHPPQLCFLPVQHSEFIFFFFGLLNLAHSVKPAQVSRTSSCGKRNLQRWRVVSRQNK